MELILIRHCQAEDVDGSRIKTDFDRPLTAKGVKQAKNLAKAIQKYIDSDTRFATSPLIRALQTMEVLCDKLGKRGTEFEVWNPLAIPMDFEKLRDSLSESCANKAVLVGHMDDLANFAGKVLGCPDGTLHFRKGAAASIIWEGGLRWGTGRLEWWITPEWILPGG
mgnify:CR=1 FL=1